MANAAKTALLEAHRRLTLPWRAWMRRRWLRQGRMPIVVLYYHRVADRSPVPWSLTNDQFAAHIDWLQRHFEMISLGEVCRRVAEGRNSRPAVHVTFDDGYAENCDRALPLLIDRQIPCTYFVTLENVNHGKSFDHDLQAGHEFPVNSIEQLRQLANQGIEIGAHTRTHPDLGQVESLEQIYDEIVTARHELADRLGRDVRYFAFPFGLPANLCGAAAAMAKADGIECVCSAYGGFNFPGDDAFHVQRCHGDRELSRIRNVVTLDPRHVFRNRFLLETSGPHVEEALEVYRQRSEAPPCPAPAFPSFDDSLEPHVDPSIS